MNKQKVILMVSLIGLALSLIYSFYRMPHQKYADKHTSSPDSRKVDSIDNPQSSKMNNSSPPKIDNKLQISLIDQQVGLFKGFKRNLFKPIFREEIKVVPLPPPPPAPVKKSILPSNVSAANSPLPPPTPVEVAKQEISRLRFIGFLKKDVRKTIFLAEGSEIFLVRKGDSIAGRYKVTNLTDEAITISVLSDNSDLVFPLIENRPLTVGRR